MHSMHLMQPARYSEDIDLVQLRSDRIGPVSKAIRNSLNWLQEEAGLGDPEHSLRKYGLKYFYKYKNIDGDISRLKIEVNTREHFHVDDLEKVSFSMNTDWDSNNCSIVSYSLEELMGTKLRALYQRRKGRDLFDIWYVFNQENIDINRVIKIFHRYNHYNGNKITKRDFLINMKDKYQNIDFRRDINALLPPNIIYDFDVAYEYVFNSVLPLI